MQISTDSLSNSIISQLQQLSSQQDVLENQISTGQDVTNPSDNPQVMGNVLNIEAEKQQLIQYSANNNLATQISQTVSSSVTGLQSLSNQAEAIATSTSGTTSSSTNTANAAVINQSIEQALQTLNTQVNGAYIFGGSDSTSPPFTATYDANGNITAVTYNGTADAPSFQVSEGATVSPYTNGATNQQLGDFVNNLITLRDALTNQDVSAVQAAQPALQTSGDNLVQTVGESGALQTRLEAESTLNQARFTNITGVESQDDSTDIAAATVKLTQAQTAYQAALECSAKIMSMALVDYLPSTS